MDIHSRREPSNGTQGTDEKNFLGRVPSKLHKRNGVFVNVLIGLSQLSLILCYVLYFINTAVCLRKNYLTKYKYIGSIKLLNPKGLKVK